MARTAHIARLWLAFGVSALSSDLDASVQAAPPAARAAALASAESELLVEAIDEVLTVAWRAGAPVVTAREARSEDTRRQLQRGVVYDARRGALYTFADNRLTVYMVDPKDGSCSAGRVIWAPPFAAGPCDLTAIPGSDELLVTNGAQAFAIDPVEPLSLRNYRGVEAHGGVTSAAIDPRSHRIAYVEVSAAQGGEARVRFANPPGELVLDGVTPTLVRWRAAGDSAAAGAPFVGALPPAAARSEVLPASLPARLAFGSCADEDEGTARAWRLLGALAPDAVVLLGDTPYIDSTDPEVQARRHHEFAAFPPFAELARTTPVFATWDDHDFGRNDSDGRLTGKEHARAAFLAARGAWPARQPGDPDTAAQPQPADSPWLPLSTRPRVDLPAKLQYGANEEGVYTSFHYPEVDVFLLDTRWFARTAPSEFDPAQPTLLGRAQWDWLREGLRGSRAEFKVLACGMIWNGAVRPGKTDHWGAYPAEFEGLCRFLGEEHISGVVLVGGDIHRSRVVVHDTKALVGYALVELISSPMHSRIIEAANVPHPGLRFDSGEGHVVCIVTALQGRLRATFQTPDAVLHEEVLTLQSLTAPR
ncbi:MAG: alkaline phosphatase D family protein [Planctomycetota bacterium]